MIKKSAMKFLLSEELKKIFKDFGFKKDKKAPLLLVAYALEGQSLFN